jgi:hypothetical protein
MDVPLGADHPLVQSDLSGRTLKDQAGASGQVPRHADRCVDAEAELLGAGDLDLGLAAHRTKDADPVDPALGTDQIDLFVARVLLRLAKRGPGRQWVARTEELLQVLLAEMRVVN